MNQQQLPPAHCLLPLPLFPSSAAAADCSQDKTLEPAAHKQILAVKSAQSHCANLDKASQRGSGRREEGGGSQGSSSNGIQ